jgi:integrase/recombinase XerD
MHRYDLLGPWVRRFLLELIVGERNLSPNTKRSYRDTLAMLLPFLSAQTGRPLDRLEVIDLSASCVRLFLAHLEQKRRVSVTTRNQHLAGIRSFARFVAERSPQHVAWFGEVKTVPCKKTIRNLICYLEKSEVEALLAIPDRTTIAGRWNHALLLFLYNSGARASEAAGLCIDRSGPYTNCNTKCPNPWQRYEGATVPALEEDHDRTGSTCGRAFADGTRIPEPAWTAAHAFRRLQPYKSLC